jgi:hypothetical protein
MKYKADLEQILRSLEPLLTEVRITDDGLSAIFQVADTYKPRKLSKLGKRFLRNGPDVILVEAESFLEPD